MTNVKMTDIKLGEGFPVAVGDVITFGNDARRYRVCEVWPTDGIPTAFTYNPILRWCEYPLMWIDRIRAKMQWFWYRLRF